MFGHGCRRVPRRHGGIATINPATGETIKTFEALSDQEVEAALDRAVGDYRTYRRSGFAERAGLLEEIARRLDGRCEELAATITMEMGKTLESARFEVRKSADIFRWFARNAEDHLADEPVDAAAVGAEQAYLRYAPLGPVLGVMPWNFPLYQVARFLAPQLMIGNVALVKHASNVPQSALLIVDIVHGAGVPASVYQTLFLEASAVERVERDRRIRGASVTGSVGAGTAVGRVAGEEIKKSVLELGGSDPFIVLPSADVEAAVRVGVVARCHNNGQSCVAAKRFIIHEAVADEFETRFVDAMSALRTGDPMDPSTDLGPLATEAGRRLVAEQVDDARHRGAVVHCGGDIPDGPGWFYPATVLAGITPDMRVFSEEVFGPVAQLYRVRDADEAVRLANATDFGLGANVWTNDAAEQQRLLRDLEAGMLTVNGATTTYPELSFGGVKRSGYGRELGVPGLREFCNVQSIWIGRAGQGPIARSE